MKKYIFLTLCLMFHSNYAEQFIYPVADFDDGHQLMVLYQKSLDNVELWIWNTETHRAIKAISSFLTPANLRMMPSGKGFSFIDQGYIKIKEFAKRSPRTLPIYDPIGLFSNMNWIDDETFYFVAREGDFFQIFQGDLQANIQRLTFEPSDALYPQKINSMLFYIKRDTNCQFSIVAQSWNPTVIGDCDHQSDLTIIQTSSDQLCFLRMISMEEGFYLQAPSSKSKNDDNYKFSCYHLKKDNNEWKTEQLFTFKIPLKYVTGVARLYESLEPFLPNYNSKGFVYFVNWHKKAEQFKLCKFDILEKTVKFVDQESLYRNDNRQIFAPYIYKDTIFCGIIAKDNRTIQNIFEADDVQLQLPYFSEK